MEFQDNMQYDNSYDFEGYDLGNRQYSERGSWLPSDSDIFYTILSKQTELINGTLYLNHQFFDRREIQLIEEAMKIFPCTGSPQTSDGPRLNNHIYSLLATDNDTNLDKSCDSMFALLNEIHMATGGRYTIRQINNKHINTRSKCAVPLKYMNEIGFFIKNQTSKRTRKTINQLLASNIPDKVILTNLDQRNYPLIKALLRYTAARELFWSDENSMPAEPTDNNISSNDLLFIDQNEAEPSTDIERWMQAMIRRHGRPMVEYLDTCVLNLVNAYQKNLVEWGELKQSNKYVFTSRTPRSSIIDTLNVMVSETKLPPKQRTARISKQIYSMRTQLVKNNALNRSPTPQVLLKNLEFGNAGTFANGLGKRPSSHLGWESGGESIYNQPSPMSPLISSKKPKLAGIPEIIQAISTTNVSSTISGSINTDATVICDIEPVNSQLLMDAISLLTQSKQPDYSSPPQLPPIQSTMADVSATQPIEMPLPFFETEKPQQLDNFNNLLSQITTANKVVSSDGKEGGYTVLSGNCNMVA